MLAEMGAHIIDTDLIAREVVEPGRPALREIEEFFGKEAINPDGTLNRKWCATGSSAIPESGTGSMPSPIPASTQSSWSA